MQICTGLVQHRLFSGGDGIWRSVVCESEKQGLWAIAHPPNDCDLHELSWGELALAGLAPGGLTDGLCPGCQGVGRPWCDMCGDRPATVRGECNMYCADCSLWDDARADIAALSGIPS